MHIFDSVLAIAHENLLVEMRSRMTLCPFEENSKLLLSDVQSYINSTGYPLIQILGPLSWLKAGMQSV